MPAQTTASAAAYYSENDRAPALLRQLLNGDGSAIDLSSATGVTIIIGHARYSHYYAPYTKIVDRAACTITDAINGWVSWEPGEGDLSPPGPYHYIFEITWPGGLRQTVPNNTYETMIIRTKPGGQEAP